MSKYYANYRKDCGGVKYKEDKVIAVFKYFYRQYCLTIYKDNEIFTAENEKEIVKLFQKLGSRKKDGYELIFIWDADELLQYIRKFVTVEKEAKSYFRCSVTKNRKDKDDLIYNIEFRSVKTYDDLTKLDALKKYGTTDDYELCKLFLIENLGKYELSKIRVTRVAQEREKFKHNLYWEVWQSDGREHYDDDLAKTMLTNYDFEVYHASQCAFHGGVCAVNRNLANITVSNIKHYDMTSCHNSSAVVMKLPVVKKDYEVFKNVSETNFKRLTEKRDEEYGGLMRLEIINPELFEGVVSGIISKPRDKKYCEEKEITIENGNYVFGNLSNADRVELTCTTQEYKNLKKIYDGKYRIKKLILFKMRLVPKKLAAGFIKMFEEKTIYKNVENKKDEYAAAKLLVVNLFGSMGMQPDKYENWDNLTAEEAVEKMNNVLEKYNNSAGFGHLLWAAFIVDYSRGRFVNAMKAAGENFVCGDTDGMCVIASEELDDYFEEINKKYTNIANSRLACYGWTLEDNLTFKDLHGNKHSLGLWECDFTGKVRTLGKKMYCVEKSDGELEIICSGLSKHAVDYLRKIGGIDKFEWGLTFPAEATKREGKVFDDDGYIVKRNESFTLGQHVVQRAAEEIIE